LYLCSNTNENLILCDEVLYWNDNQWYFRKKIVLINGNNLISRKSWINEILLRLSISPIKKQINYLVATKGQERIKNRETKNIAYLIRTRD